MEKLAQRIRELEYNICAIETVVTQRRTAKSLYVIAETEDNQGFCTSNISGFYKYKGASGWDRRFKKHGKQAIRQSRGGRNTKLHVVAASDRDAVTFSLSSGQAGDGPQGRKLLATLGDTSREVYLLMDRGMPELFV